MAQERRVSMTCSVLANRMRSSKSFAPKRQLEGGVEAQTHCHRPGRVHCSSAVHCE
jgi:hypothetical protein